MNEYIQGWIFVGIVFSVFVVVIVKVMDEAKKKIGKKK